MNFLSTLIALLGVAPMAFANVKKQDITYSAGVNKMQGFVAYMDSGVKKPGVIIIHDWMGLGEFTKAKAEQLAKQGYVALAADVYGMGVRPANVEEASQLATKYKEDRALLRTHVRAAFEELLNMPNVDRSRIVVMGYCFGGTAALELARSGAGLVGTVSFHGGLSTPTPEDAKNIRGRVLALHGAQDPLVPAKEVEGFKEEMRKAKIDLKFVAYPGAVHAFTNPKAGSDKSKGAAYNADADKKSWAEFQNFLKSVTQ